MDNFVHILLITLYIVAVSWLLLCSSSFHLFNCRSPASYACTARLDYSGIGLVILMSQWGGQRNQLPSVFLISFCRDDVRVYLLVNPLHYFCSHFGGI
jgi:predicted membrane channel-forming protein YqfA (hemolysin III family)